MSDDAQPEERAYADSSPFQPKRKPLLLERARKVMTVAGVVAVGVLQALVFTVGLSIVDVVRRSARPHDAVLGWVDELGRYGDVAVHRSARVTPGVVVYRLDDWLYLANAGYFNGRVLEAVCGSCWMPRR